MSSHVPAAGSAASDGSEDAATAGGAPRSLAQSLRSHDDAALAALLRARPDLLSPVPADLSQLAGRAATRASVIRAVERLDLFALQTAEALAVAPDPASYGQLLALMAGGDGDPAVAAALPRALGTLREQALVWGEQDRLRLVRTARELLAPGPQHPSPTGLGPTLAEAAAGMSPGRVQEIVAAAGLPRTHDSVSAVRSLTGLFTAPARMAALLADAPPAALDVLGRLQWGPPYGKVTAEPAAHLRWLLDRGLLLPASPGTVLLPREAALHLRGGRAHRATEPEPPAAEITAEHTGRLVDATAAGQAQAALATVEELLRDWDEGGPAVLRAGGLSVRDLKRTAAALDTTVELAAFWAELAFCAGLLASDGDADERFAATPAYDEWLELPDSARWSRLIAAWLAATRTAGLVGTRDAKDRTLSALGPGLDRSAAPEVRLRVLQLLAALPEGAAATAESILDRLAWEHPLRGAARGEATGVRDGAGRDASRGREAVNGQEGYGSWAASGGRDASGEQGAAGQRDDLRSRLARWTLREAELLGVTGRGALAAHGRALLEVARGAGAPAPAVTVAPAHASMSPATSTPTSASGRGGATGGDAAAYGLAHRPGRDGTADTGFPPAEATPAPGEHGTAEGHFALTPVQHGTAERHFTPAPGQHAPADGDFTPPPGATTPAPTAAPTFHTPATAAHAADQAGRLLAPLLPQPVDEVLLQADLTAVAPGPLRRPLAQALGVLADVESKGGATVYRFTPGSVRRALDAGQSAAELHAFLAAHSRTPVPQPLAYLIDDVARRHGHLRIGAASAYVRCDDEAMLGEILADRRAQPLRLRRLAPTVLAAQSDPGTLLEGLRAMGFAPAAESAEGDVVVTRADSRRTGPRTAPEPVLHGPPHPDPTLLTAAVRAIRAGDLASTAPRRELPEHAGELPRTSSAETLATVQAAALTNEAVWIGYVNAEGTASQRVIAPIRVEGGFVTAFDHTADEVRTYPLHRITGVAELTGG